MKESDEELSRLRGKLRELEDALAHARRSAHRTGVDNREVSGLQWSLLVD